MDQQTFLASQYKLHIIDTTTVNMSNLSYIRKPGLKEKSGFVNLTLFPILLGSKISQNGTFFF